VHFSFNGTERVEVLTYCEIAYSHYVCLFVSELVTYSFTCKLVLFACHTRTCWAMHKLGVEEWLVSAVMFMYIGAKTVVRTVYGNSNGFEVCVDLLLLQMLPIATSRFQRA